MNLRLKFTILIGLAITAAVVLATSTVYWIAREELEKEAAQRLQQTTSLISTQVEARFEALLRSVHVWAQTDLVQKALLNPHDPALIDRVNHTFAHIVQNEPVLQTFNLFDTQAAVVASSIPERVGLQVARDVVREREDFLAALAGKRVVKGPFIGLSSGQPVISLAVPVRAEENVIGVLRPIIGIAELNEKLLKPLMKGLEGRLLIFAPDLDTKRKITPVDPTLVIETPYVAPGIPAIPEMHRDKKGIVEYTSGGVERYAAFQWMQQPRALVVVEMPLRDVLAPIRHIQYAAVVIALIMVPLIWVLAGFALRPLLSNLRACLQFAGRIRDGHLEERIRIKSRDDVGELASGLNEMAERLEHQRVALKESEIKYRSIFETTVEGIFQTSRDGRFLTANPALAKILGVNGTETLFRHRVHEFYADPEERESLMDKFRREREVTRYEFDVRRLDGEIRRCFFSGRAHMDGRGRLAMVQGVLHDVTRERSAEAAKHRAETAERLALQARLQALRYQINPHFIFNVLNTIDVLSRKKPERIPDLLHELASYLRYTLHPKAQGGVLLHEELGSVKAYLAIEKVRFTDHLKVVFDIAPDAADAVLPDMVFQPLVENAIKHGMQTSDMPLKLVIRAEINDGYLYISVRNTGRWVEASSAGTGRPPIGLANLRERLEVFYGDDFSFETSVKDGWVKIAIRLPRTPVFAFQSPG
jgi:PAS domain S-box-containing protein